MEIDPILHIIHVVVFYLLVVCADSFEPNVFENSPMLNFTCYARLGLVIYRERGVVLHIG